MFLSLHIRSPVFCAFCLIMQILQILFMPDEPSGKTAIAEIKIGYIT